MNLVDFLSTGSFTLLLLLLSITGNENVIRLAKAVSTSVVAEGTIAHAKQGYTSEYSVECGSTGLSYYDAARVCRGKSAGWDLAIVVDQEAEDFLEKSTGEGIWLGTDRKLNTLQGVKVYDFRWGANTRLEEVSFASMNRTGPRPYTFLGGCTDSADIYCNFPKGEPTPASFRCGATITDAKRVVIPPTASTSGGKRYWVLEGYECTTETKCFACERTQCGVKADCTELNTASASGHFPDCTCTCKNGASGKKCEIGGSTATAPTVPITTTTVPTTVPITTETTTGEPSEEITTKKATGGSSEETSDNKGKTIAIIVGSIFGAIFLIGLIILVVFLLKRRSNVKKGIENVKV